MIMRTLLFHIDFVRIDLFILFIDHLVVLSVMIFDSVQSNRNYHVKCFNTCRAGSYSSFYVVERSNGGIQHAFGSIVPWIVIVNFR